MRYEALKAELSLKWYIHDSETGLVVERHKTFAAATDAAKRLNGICLHCDRPLVDCKRDNPRDESFGGEYDDSDETAD